MLPTAEFGEPRRRILTKTCAQRRAGLDSLLTTGQYLHHVGHGRKVEPGDDGVVAVLDEKGPPLRRCVSDEVVLLGRQAEPADVALLVSPRVGKVYVRRGLFD